ncbi:MAG TPA: hypothetical protein PK176_04395 [Acidobacteriota bacterium]|nr:hypothetical protein [Acidobacteriota bacterium]HQM62527.1 hypothetical protein [Acidobacteriota bacterium]
MISKTRRCFASGGALGTVDITHSLTPRPNRGFHQASAGLAPDGRLVVDPGTENYPLAKHTAAVSLRALGGMVRRQAGHLPNR